jgi:hypothetical protein
MCLLCRPAPGQSRFRANGSHQAFAADGPDSPFFEVDFGTLSPLVVGRFVAAAEMQALGGYSLELNKGGQNYDLSLTFLEKQVRSAKGS